MDSARLAFLTGETHVWKPQGHDKGPASGLSDWPHCAGKLTYGIPMGPGDTPVWHHPGLLLLNLWSFHLFFL